MVPTSLPGAMPSGIVATRPSSPRDAIRSMLGLRAASSGVLPPCSSHGQSAMPSPWIITYFNAGPPLKVLLSLKDRAGLLLRRSAWPTRERALSALEDLEDLRNIGLDDDRIAEVLHCSIGVLQAVTGERADHD